MNVQVKNIMEVRAAGPGINNVSCMTTVFLLAASEIIDHYDFKDTFASIPEVYNSFRLKTIGLNMLKVLAYHAEHDSFINEFNSPTYTPISILHMAYIVELIDDCEARRIALKIERKIWNEVLSMHHPELGLSCGPFSRAYRVDIIGQLSAMRTMFCYLGISKD